MSAETSSAVEPELELTLCKIVPATLDHMLLVQQGFIQQILTDLLLKIRDTKLVPVPNSTFKMRDNKKYSISYDCHRYKQGLLGS